MSNPLSVRRVKVQTIDNEGNLLGEPTFGIMAADSYEQVYNDTFQTLAELNDAIDNAESILAAVDGDNQFPEANHDKIGRDNYYGKNWYMF